MRITLFLALLFGLVAIAGAEPLTDVRANYLFSCRGCHLADGRGVPPDVPTLRDTLGASWHGRVAGNTWFACPVFSSRGWTIGRWPRF